MGESKFSLSVQPGVLAAILFIGLDIITLGILDIVLSRVVCLVYYRKINRGRPVSVKSADIPGLTNYLLGKFFSLTNLAALGVKLSLLAVVFVVNLRIDSDSAFARVPVQRTSVFEFAPSDAEFERTDIRTVRRRPESSKACVREGGDDADDDGQSDRLTYYQLAFDLRNDVELTDDIGVEGVNTPGQFDIDDATIVCMSPANVHNERAIATVLGCTRKPDSGCLTVISGDKSLQKNVTARVVSDEEWTRDGDEATHNLTVYDPAAVSEMFAEYADPVLTCLSTSVGITEFGGVSRYRHCLMVAHNATATLVERWIVQRKANASSDELVLEYPGVVFEGDVKIEQRIAARYLQVLFPFTTYRSLSGQLVADGAKFAPLPQTVVRNGDVKTVTTIPVWAVFLVVAAVVLVVTGRVVTYIVLRKDKRPKFNTIDGLSSIVREECVPSGRSYDAGDSAVLGLRYTTDDLLHFGPLTEATEGARYDAAQDIS